jgi:hypothetical protein
VHFRRVTDNRSIRRIHDDWTESERRLTFLYRFFLWQDGVSDMPELRALKPKEAFELVCAASWIEYEATFWNQMSVRNVVWTFGLLTLFYVILGVAVISRYRDLFIASYILILLFIVVGGIFFRRRDQSRRLRPRIHEVLKARQASATGAC